MSILDKIKLANDLNREIEDFSEPPPRLVQDVIDIFNSYGLEYKEELENFNKEFIKNLKNTK
jgi:hypothetical protein